MYSAFEKQPQEKKDLIIKTAIEEFVKNGYEKTSTDVITNRAGISKGILFHYFKSKKKLYLYLVNYVTELLMGKTMEALIEIKSKDFFERVKEIYLLKNKVTVPYIQETQFMTDAFINPPISVKAEMEELQKKYLEKYYGSFLMEHIFQKDLIQTEKLREDISVDTVIQMTMFVSEQLSYKYQTLYKNKQYDYFKNMNSMSDPLLQEINDYLKIIEYGVYKSEKV